MCTSIFKRHILEQWLMYGQNQERLKDFYKSDISPNTMAALRLQGGSVTFWFILPANPRCDDKDCLWLVSLLFCRVCHEVIFTVLNKLNLCWFLTNWKQSSTECHTDRGPSMLSIEYEPRVLSQWPCFLWDLAPSPMCGLILKVPHATALIITRDERKETKTFPSG